MYLTSVAAHYLSIGRGPVVVVRLPVILPGLHRGFVSVVVGLLGDPHC
jgi:hypothetical protein